MRVGCKSGPTFRTNRSRASRPGRPSACNDYNVIRWGRDARWRKNLRSATDPANGVLGQEAGPKVCSAAGGGVTAKVLVTEKTRSF